MMNEVVGSLGTKASLVLRLGQIVFSCTSLFFMCLDASFYSYTAFCFLVTVMGLVIPWSVTLGLVDAYCVFVTRPTHQLGFMSSIALGDFVLAFLQLGAASSSAGVAQFFVAQNAPMCIGNTCTRYSLSAMMAFLSWLLSLASSLFNIWLLPRL